MKILCVLCVLCGSGYAVAAQVEPPDYERTFDRIWRTTRDNFYDPDMHGLDWRAVGDRYRGKAAAARSKQEFQAIVNQMLAELRASHLAYLTDDDLEFYLLQSLFNRDARGFQAEHIGVMGERENGVFVVRAILDDGPAARARIKVGDRLLEVEGRPFSTVGAFRGRADASVDLTLERPGAGRMTVSIVPRRENPQRAFLEATRRSVRVIERGGKRLGYIHLWCMTSDLFRQALEEALLGPLARTDGLILDLRDGYGGQPHRFADVLFRPDVEWTEKARGRTRAVRRTGYSKPLVVLINRGTRSAKESFAYQIKKSRRGILVGTTTAGAFLGAGGFPIRRDGYLELPVVELLLDGKRLEGAGIAPDVVVEAEDAYGPNDRQLRRAEEILLDRRLVERPQTGAAQSLGFATSPSFTSLREPSCTRTTILLSYVTGRWKWILKEPDAADCAEDRDAHGEEVEWVPLHESDDRRQGGDETVGKKPRG